MSVSHGVVTLEGEVEHFFEKMEAEQHISLLNGLTRIDNKLVVTPGVSPIDVKDKIEAAFQRNASLDESERMTTLGRLWSQGDAYGPGA